MDLVLSGLATGFAVALRSEFPLLAFSQRPTGRPH